MTAALIGAPFDVLDALLVAVVAVLAAVVYVRSSDVRPFDWADLPPMDPLLRGPAAEVAVTRLSRWPNRRAARADLRAAGLR